MWLASNDLKDAANDVANDIALEITQKMISEEQENHVQNFGNVSKVFFSCLKT